MTALFTRYGEAHEPVGTDDTGRPYFLRDRKCTRCGGAGGADKWLHTGRTCYDCGGSGKHINGAECVKLYTREENEKLDAAQVKRTAKLVAKADVKAAEAKAEADARRVEFEARHGALLSRAAPFCERNEFVRDVVRKGTERATLTAGQVEALTNAIERMAAQDAAKAASGHVGAPGSRIECPVTVERVASFDRPAFGSGRMETVWVVTMRDPDGNAIVSRTPRFHPEKGESFTLRATVKEHSEYRGEKQTLVQRCDVKMMMRENDKCVAS